MKKNCRAEVMTRHTQIGGRFCPLIRFDFIACKHRFSANKVPGTESHHSRRMSALSSDRVEVYAEGGIARTSQLAMLIGVAHAKVGLDVTKLRALSEQLSGVLFVLENVAAKACFVE